MARVMGDLAAANLMVQELYAAIGEQVREARQSRGVTQQYLATAVGLTRSSLTNIESGRQRPPLHTVIAIAQALGIEPCVLISGDALPVLAPVLPSPHTQLRRALRDAQERIDGLLEQLPDDGDV